MANRARRLPAARRDLIGIWRFIADDNEAAADRLLARIEQSIVMLREHPFAGATGQNWR
nr:type II toxin-antitoxin system RelE/ParE family toxin [Bosea vaviloviae]